MTAYEMTAQGIGICAMAFNILSYQQKNAKGVMTFQFMGAFLFSVNFLMLEAYVGFLLNAIAVIRTVVYLNRDKLRADHIAWFAGFIISYCLSYLLSFTLFQKPFTVCNALIELLPIIGMTAQNIGLRRNTAKAIRLFGFVSSPSWLVYNIFNIAIGAVICEVLSLGSIIISFIRYDVKKTRN